MAGMASSQVMTCRGVQYDRFTHVCCVTGELLPIALGIPPAQARCCNGEVINNATEGCCAGDAFTLVDQLCCEGKVTTDGGPLTHTCCGDNTYVTREMKMCCRRNVVNGNPQFQLCCEGETIDKSSYRCCNDRTKYDFRSKVCCNGRLQDYPGGEDQWQCCGGTVFRRASTNQACCGTDKVYDPQSHYCCGSDTVQRESTTFGCCNMTGIRRSFNVQTQSCCKSGTTVLPGTQCPAELKRIQQEQEEAKRAAEAKAAAARKSVAETVGQRTALQQWQARMAAAQRAAAYMAAAQRAAQAAATTTTTTPPPAVVPGQKSAADMVYPVIGGDVQYGTFAAVEASTNESPTSAGQPVVPAQGYAAWLQRWKQWISAYMMMAQQRQQQEQQGQAGQQQQPPQNSNPDYRPQYYAGKK